MAGLDLAHQILLRVDGERERARLRRVDRTWASAHRLLEPGPRVVVLHASSLAVHETETLRRMYRFDLGVPTSEQNVFDNVSRTFTSYTEPCEPRHLVLVGAHAYVLYRNLWLQCFDMSSRRQLWLKELADHHDARGMAAAGEYVAAAFWDGVVVCRAGDGTVVKLVHPPSAGEYTLCCAFSSDATKLAVAGGVPMIPSNLDDGIHVWSTTDWTIVARIPARGFTTSVNCALSGLDPTNSGLQPSPAHTSCARRHHYSPELTRSRATLAGVAFVGPRQDMLLSGSNDSRFCIWQLPTAESPVPTPRVHAPIYAKAFHGWVGVCAASADGQRILCSVERSDPRCVIFELGPPCPHDALQSVAVKQLAVVEAARVRSASFLGLHPCLLLSDPRLKPSDSLLLQRVVPPGPSQSVTRALEEGAAEAVAWQPPSAYQDFPPLAASQPPPPPATSVAPAHPPGPRHVSWAHDVYSPGCTREALHKAARTKDIPIAWRDPIRVVRLRHAGSVTMTHELDWEAIGDVNEELRDPDHSSASRRAKRRGA